MFVWLITGLVLGFVGSYIPEIVKKYKDKKNNDKKGD